MASAPLPDHIVDFLDERIRHHEQLAEMLRAVRRAFDAPPVAVAPAPPISPTDRMTVQGGVAGVLPARDDAQ